MSKKSKSKRRILWSLLAVFCTLVLAVIVVPPMITLNSLKPNIENFIFSKTGVPAKIKGDINFSLLWRTTIVAHDIHVPNGTISSCEFTVPFLSILNLEKTEILGDIAVNGASLSITKITPFDIDTNINVKDSEIKFLNKTYDIISANLSKQFVSAIVRTDQHKYEIESSDNNFTIKNKNNELNLSGTLYPDGSATAHISIIAQNINRWFEFKTPHISGRFPITADLSWNGGYGIKFDNISANGVYGSIEYKDDGHKIIKLQSNDANYNMSFLIKNPKVLLNTDFDLNFYGDMIFMNQKIHHLKIITTGTEKQINIDSVIADEIHISGGYIDSTGAHDVNIAGPLSGLHTTCLFNGTPTDWYCSKYSHGNNITSVFSVKNDVIDADVYSTAIYADMRPFVVTIRKLASSGEVRFYYPDMVGILHLKKDSYTVDYSRLDNKSLNQAKINLKFLPDFMKDEPGDFVWINGVMIFTANSKQWILSKSTDFFILRGENFKQLTTELDLQSLNDLPYVLSGNYKNGNISDFTIEIADSKFTGMLSGKFITLKTDVLNIDSFANQSFIQKFEDLSFFTNHPILLPFESKYNIALSANELIFNSTKYKNFLYSLRRNTQTFSISDSDRGNLLVTIYKNNIKYAINLQLNKFMFDTKILPEHMPLNISNTSITAEIKLNTYGKIAHDIINNLEGTFNASFDGGKLYGLGMSEFYAYAPHITLLNGEDMLDKALSGGTTPIKKMHIVGLYKNGDIQTTKPLTLSMPHTDASGMFEIKNKEMTAKLRLVLRGTSADPEPIDLIIYPNNSRYFSLSEIMLHFDPEYMRAFVQTHNKF